MADVRINQLPDEASPVASDVLAIDSSTIGGSTRKTTIEAAVLIGRPAASQAEAEAGTNPTKAMTPLTTAQAIAAQAATAAQGAKADTALQPTAIGVSVQAFDAGLQSIAGLTTAADQMIYTTASDAYATTALTPFARTVLDDASAADIRATLIIGAASAGKKGQPLVVNAAGTGYEEGGDLTGDFFAEDGARIIRQADRVFVGDAVANNGTNVGSQPDWLTQYLLGKGRTFAFQQVTQNATLTTNNPLSCNAILGGAQTSPMTALGNAIGVLGVAVNNENTFENNAFGGYFEGFQNNGAAGGTYGVEVDTINFDSAVTIDPFQQQAKQTIGVQIAAGAEFVGTFSISSAINIRNNQANYLKGITFGDTSISGTNGIDGGTGVAIAFATGHTMAYYYGAGTVNWQLYAGIGANGDYNFTSNGTGSVSVPRLKETVGDAWTTYTPTITAVSGTFTSVSASGRYRALGKSIEVSISIAITTNGTAAGGVIATLPVAAASGIGYVLPGSETAALGFACLGRISASATTVQIFKYDNTYPGANGHTIVVTGVYQRS